MGIGQSYDIFFGADEFRSNPNMKPIAGEIIYQDEHTTYCESFFIDFAKYAAIFSVNSFADDFHDDMKKQLQELKHLVRVLEKTRSSKNPVDTDK